MEMETVSKPNVFLISYEMNIYGNKLYQIYNAIKSCSYEEKWLQCLNNVWIIKTKLSINSVYERIKEVLGGIDCFIIIEIVDNYDGWVDDKIWEYLNTEIFEKIFSASED